MRMMMTVTTVMMQEDLHFLNIWVMQERHDLDGTSVPLQKILLWAHKCY